MIMNCQWANCHGTAAVTSGIGGWACYALLLGLTMLLLFRIAEDKERLLTVVRMDIQEIQSRQ